MMTVRPDPRSKVSVRMSGTYCSDADLVVAVDLVVAEFVVVTVVELWCRWSSWSPSSSWSRCRRQLA
jgi:hypothetical protein